MDEAVARGEESGAEALYQRVPEKSALPPAEARLVLLMEEFRRRQRERPDLVVRPWWAPESRAAGGTVGFVLEYCPAGGASAEVRVRTEGVAVDGPAGYGEAALELEAGWVLAGRDAGSPEILANLILRLAADAIAATTDAAPST